MSQEAYYINTVCSVYIEISYASPVYEIRIRFLQMLNNLLFTTVILACLIFLTSVNEVEGMIIRISPFFFFHLSKSSYTVLILDKNISLSSLSLCVM